MAKNLVNNLDRYQDSCSVQKFKNKNKSNPKKKHVKTSKRKEVDFD